MARRQRSAAIQADQRIERIVVVGAGDCGTRAAIAMRTAGWDGQLTLVGAEITAPYERPPLSKAVLTQATPPPPIASDDALADANISWRPGVSAIALDRQRRRVSLDDGSSTGFDRLLIATGARPRQPPVPGPDVILSLRTVGDAQRLRERFTSGAKVLIIGGGFIGLEVAASAVTLGCDVTVVEFAHRLMSRVVPAKVAEIVQQRHVDAGVRLLCGVGAVRISANGGDHAVTLTDGSTVRANVVVAGVGATPNTELAASAGLTIANGVAVDAGLRTEDPNVFAAGDCCSFPHSVYGGKRVRLEAWRNALEHADIAAVNMLGGDRTCNTVPWFWSDQYDLGIQIAGLHAEAAYEVVRRRDDGVDIRFGLDNTGRVVSASGAGVGTSVGRDISIAERLITERARPGQTTLADPSVQLRELAGAAASW
jgi:3-phenylpropionate/trans-cinnamate dioxygenase ferredoxin reductase component